MILGIHKKSSSVVLGNKLRCKVLHQQAVQVATEQGYDARTFLEQVSLKAGLPKQAWREADTTLTVFEGEPFFGQDRIATAQWRMEQKGLSRK